MPESAAQSKAGVVPVSSARAVSAAAGRDTPGRDAPGPNSPGQGRCAGASPVSSPGPQSGPLSRRRVLGGLLGGVSAGVAGSLLCGTGSLWGAGRALAGTAGPEVSAGAAGLADAGLVATLIDVDACTGCGACVTACRERNLARVPLPDRPIPQPWPPSVRIQDWSGRRDVTDRLTPYNWLYIQSCVVRTRKGERCVFLPRRCLQCVNPTCVNLCPTGAARECATGAVYIDGATCLGDGRCIRFCPWGIPRRQSGVGVYLDLLPRYIGNGRVFKCDYCHELLAQGREPACVAACPHRAQRVGPRADILALAQRMAAERGGDIYGLHVNGGTNTLYVSALQFRDIEVELLRQDQIGPGRPSLKPAGASMVRENRLLGTVLAAPLAGAAVACLRLWRDSQKGRP